MPFIMETHPNRKQARMGRRDRLSGLGFCYLPITMNGYRITVIFVGIGW